MDRVRNLSKHSRYFFKMARRVGPYIPQTSFTKKRREDRETVFSPANLKAAWRDARKILKEIPVTDIFEYHDVSSNLTEISASISFRIGAGDYESLRNDEFRAEKKDGVTRRIVILFPEDSIIFSAINKYAEDFILSIAPTKKSYYVRDNTPKTINDLPGDPYMHWSKLWALYQEEIQCFSGKRKYTVVTDVASYYDTINLSVLKERLQSKN
ncbi:hypothetical protein [Deinococcus radiopugnans]|uniref:hypothetical protein n=1 Tax=Deinococcus radiopugnans TaxID=57497 RepID=UPI0012E00E0F|nr:hypothetical protein [Deinococcus radiopugnans]